MQRSRYLNFTGIMAAALSLDISDLDEIIADVEPSYVMYSFQLRVSSKSLSIGNKTVRQLLTIDLE